jgi:alpha-tubulin suppressor-like RCC1 family protein
MVRAGWSHTCAITPADVAFCWGENGSGQLGDGTLEGAGRAVPVRVKGGLAWEQLSGGANFTCGVTTGQRLYCWGSNEWGQLGDGSTIPRLTPRAVSGGRSYRQVDAGGAGHVCAVSTEDLAYCWGLNLMGALGDGTTSNRLTPGAVAGLRRFDHLNAGHYHTCGVTRSGKTFCWGRNDLGELGDGTNSQRLKPVAVAGSLTMRQVSAGLYHTCGVTSGDRAYCWGNGQLLGDGNTTPDFVPVPVAPPQ